MSPAGLKKNPRQPRIPTAPRNARAIQQLMWTSARNKKPATLARRGFSAPDRNAVLFDFHRLRRHRRCGVRFRELQLDLILLVQVDRHAAAGDQATEQQLVGQGLAYHVLDQARHRARAHQRVEAFLAEELAQLLGEDRLDFFIVQLFFQLHQELVDDAQDDLFVQRAEADGRVDPVAELRREHALDVGHLVASLLGVGEADRRLLQAFGARVGGHDDDHVAEVGLASVVVGQRAMVHHLQQDVEDVRMRFFDFIEQQYGARIRRDTAWRSMYSDMSKRISSMPRMKASCLATSVLPTPVGPENRKEPIGLSVLPRPARAILIADASASIAGSWPNTTLRRSRSMVCSLLRSSWLTVCGGMRAILAMMSSISVLPMVFFCFDFGRMRCAAPASSITSMALSGRWRSLMKRAASSAAVDSADDEYFTPWCSSKRDFRPRRICTVCSTVGSLTSTFWKRRLSAWSFSNTPRNSV